MTSTQWNEAHTALSSDCGGGSTPPAQAPAVVTESASGVTASGATLNGTVDPEGADTTYQFQYGTGTGYGSVAPASQADAGSGSSAIGESAVLSGLTAGTTYDYRLVATNASGTTDGELYSFYGFDSDIGSAGSTPGYTYELDDNGNVYAYDTASPSQAPAFGDSGIAFGIAVLMESTAS